MPIYRTRTGLYVGRQSDAGKDFETIDLPRNPDIIAALNAAHEHGYDQGVEDGAKYGDKTAVEVASGVAPAAAPPPPAAAGHGYSSPMCADTTIQRIDANMIASAVKSMTDPQAFATVASAFVGRFAEIEARAGQVQS